MLNSNIRCISRGQAAENKERGTKLLKVWPIEILPEIANEITDDEEYVESKGIDKDASEYTVRVVRCAYIEATWGGDTNRKTPPDVRRGERVNIYQVGDSQTYYWESAGLDDNLRRLETVVYTYNANPENTDNEPGPEDTYSLEVNTHDGHVTFRTTAKNGEKATYTLQFNTKEGIFILEDDKGNHIYLDSVNTDIEIRNADDSFIQLIKEIINIETKILNTKCKTFNLTVAEKMTAIIGELDVTVDGLTKIKTGTLNIEAGPTIMKMGTVDYTASMTTVNGPVLFTSPVAFAAGIGGGGPGGTVAPLEVSSAANFTKATSYASAASFTAHVTFSTISGGTATFPNGKVGP